MLLQLALHVVLTQVHAASKKIIKEFRDNLMQFFRFAVLAISLVVASLASADELSGISVMTLSPADGKAVVKSSSHPLTVVSVGDTLFDSPYIVSQILPNKLLVKDKRKPGFGNLIWIYQAKPNLPSRIERVEEKPPETSIKVPAYEFH